MKPLPKTILYLALLGLAFSLYALYHHYEVRSGGSTWCNFGETLNCDKVALSAYSEIFGIPVPFLGLLWFLVALLLYFAPEINGLKSLTEEREAFYLFGWSLLGIAFIVWFAYIELFQINAICLNCTIIHLIILATSWAAYQGFEKPFLQHVIEHLSE